MNASVEFIRALAVDPQLLDRLKTLPFSKTGTRRICLHESEGSPLHIMLVESKPDVPFPGHYHSDSDEVCIVVSGQLEIKVWSDGPNQFPTTLLLSQENSGTKISIVQKHMAHTTRAIGGNCTYLEVKLGPFKKDALVVVDNLKMQSDD